MLLNAWPIMIKASKAPGFELREPKGLPVRLVADA